MGKTHTPLVMRVPIRVMRPFRLSDRTEESTKVDPFSDGANKAAHSSRPAFSDCRVSRSWTSSHSSSRFCDAVCSSARRASSMGGHTAVDMAAAVIRQQQGGTTTKSSQVKSGPRSQSARQACASDAQATAQQLEQGNASTARACSIPKIYTRVISSSAKHSHAPDAAPSPQTMRQVKAHGRPTTL